MYMSYNQLAEEQKKDLGYKIVKACKAIEEALSLCKHRPAIAFSGGKDSTVLWHLIRTCFPEWTDRIVMFDDTQDENMLNYDPEEDAS